MTTNKTDRLFVPFWIVIEYLDKEFKDPWIEVQIIQHKQMNASRAKKATYNAIGNRVKEVKKRLAGSDVGSIYNAVELVVAPELIDWDA